jgi:hypothetical protein
MPMHYDPAAYEEDAHGAADDPAEAAAAWRRAMRIPVQPLFHICREASLLWAWRREA